ncbi:MAG TPA: response regulator transcription factor [Candidatus Angelobacter sp.]|nr:response regulator transcription factor [Candidatus Angelobacter sp.]
MRNQPEISAIDQAEPTQQHSTRHEMARHQGEQKISVVVSDGSYMSSELLGRALSRIKTLTVLKSTANYDEALEAIIDLQPDVVVVGLHFGNAPYKGLELLRRLRDSSAKSRCVLLMDDAEREGVIEAFRAGARGIFRRSTSTHLLARCIAAVNKDQIWASSADVMQVIGALQTVMPFKGVNSRGEELLTKREQELVPLVAHGMTNREISNRLGVSEHTIKNHLFRIYEKLGISSRVELILYAVSERDRKL